jgi:hypothetical protein
MVKFFAEIFAKKSHSPCSRPRFQKLFYLLRFVPDIQAKGSVVLQTFLSRLYCRFRTSRKGVQNIYPRLIVTVVYSIVSAVNICVFSRF